MTCLLLITLALPPAPVELQDYYLVFTANDVPYNPAKAHTFATHVRVAVAAGQPPQLVETETLSWLPETLKVRPFAFRSEKGRNVPLEETLQIARKNGARVNLWGPYRVQPEFAEIFKARVIAVESSFGYKGACLTSPLRVCDCARSVEEMIEPRRRFIGAFGYGAAAGSYIVNKFSPWLIEPHQTHDWVGTMIGIDDYAITRRAYGDYTTRTDQFKLWLRRE